MQLYKAALIHAFGRGSQRPLRAAMLRLAGLGLGSLVLGLLFMWSIRNLPLMPPAHLHTVLFAGVFTVQIIVVLALIASAGFLGTGSRDTLARLLLVLPIGNTKRGILLLMPSLVLAGLALLLVGWSLGIILLKLGMPALLLPLTISLGLLSGFGLLFGLPMPKASNWRIVIIPLVIWFEYKLTNMLVSNEPPQAAVLLMYGLVTAGLAGLFLRGVPRIASNPACFTTGKTIRTAWLAPRFWFVKKMWRSGTLPYNFVVTLCLSISLAVVSHRQGFADPSMLALFGALFAGSFASDIRGLARRYRPAEITALRGTARFAVAQLVAACLCGLVLAAPLASSIAINNMAAFAAQVILGISIGLCAGTLIVPESRDIMGQFLAVLIILAVLAAIPQLPVMNQLSAAGLAAGQIALTILSTVFALAIEYKRNPYQWKDTYHAQ